MCSDATGDEQDGAVSCPQVTLSPQPTDLDKVDDLVRPLVLAAEGRHRRLHCGLEQLLQPLVVELGRANAMVIQKGHARANVRELQD